jgi:hypothetical protein
MLGIIPFELLPRNRDELIVTRTHAPHNDSDVCVLNIVEAVRIGFQFAFHSNQPGMALCKADRIMSSTRKI